MTWPLIQVLLAQRVPVHRFLLPHVEQKLPSERQALLKRRQRERSVDQDLLPCAAPRHPNVRRYWVSTDHVNDHARLYCASLRAVERVGEVGRDGKLVPGDFQLWVGAARVQKPHSTLHAHWEDVLLIDAWDSPPCACFKTHEDILGKFVPNDCSICRCCVCFNARPPADCSMAPFQNLELLAVEMLSCLHWHTNAQRKDAVPVAAVGVAALQPRELVVGDVAFLVQRSCWDFVRSHCIVNDLPTLSRPLFRAKFVYVALHPVRMENTSGQAETLGKPRIVWSHRNQTLTFSFGAAGCTFVYENCCWRGTVLVQAIAYIFSTSRLLRSCAPASRDSCGSAM